MSVTSVALRGKLFAEEREEGVDSEGSLQREGICWANASILSGL